MEEDGDIIYSVSYTTILALCFFLAALLILLFILYKYLNKEANGKYTVQRIVFREGGLRDRARGAAVTLGNRLGVQLWPQSDTDQDEENGEDEEEANSSGNESSDEDADAAQVNEQKSDSMAEVNNAKGSSGDDSLDSSDEEEQAKAKPEPESKAVKTEEAAGDDVQESKAGETSAPIVINLNQFSGSVLWAEEEKCEEGDVTAL